MWDASLFKDNVSRLVDALAPLTSPTGGFGSATVRDVTARGRHVVEQIRHQVVPHLPDLVAQDAVGMLARLEEMLGVLGNPSATRADQIRAAAAARAWLESSIGPTIGQALTDGGISNGRRAVLFTRDVRVCELQFLSAIEQAGDFCFTPGKDAFRDTPADVVRQMTYSLVEDGILNGPASLADDADPRHADTRRTADLRSVLRGEVTDLRLNHRGRLRLARLRDELLAFDKKERFGILLDSRGLDRVLAAELAVTTMNRRLAIIAGDVDHFKHVNDEYGHPRGDEVLKAVFRIFSEAIDTHGNAFRQGGEEVIGVLPIESLAKATAMAEAVRLRVASDVERECKLLLPLTISLGVLVLDDGSLTPAQVIERADELLFRAKKEGRNRVVSEELGSESQTAENQHSTSE